MKTKVTMISIFLVMMGVVSAALPVTDGLITHLDADSLALADGASVATWTDTSGAGNDATQTTASAQPAYVASSPSFNDLASIRFDGSDDWIDMVDVVAVDSFTLFIVGKLTDTEAEQYFISGQSGNPTALDNRLRIAKYNWSNAWRFRAGNTDYSSSTVDPVGHVFAINSVSNAWIDGSGFIGGTNTATSTPALSLGAYMRTGGGGYLNGEIAEVVLFNRELSEQEVDNVNEHLRVKYFPTQVATNPSPSGDGIDVDAILSWDSPEAYDATYNVYFGTTEPNFNEPAPYGLTQIGTAGQTTTTATPVPSPMSYETTYHWVVDAFEPNDIDPSYSILHQGEAWSFATSPSDNVPEVTSGSDWITWLDNGTVTQDVSATVDDNGEEDIADADINWSIQEYPGGAPATAMQMVDRGGDDTLPDGETDGALLRDWIGTDTRGVNLAGDPLTLTIAGLASGSYTLTTIHHDLHDQTGNFDIAVDGTTVATGVDITSGTESPITRHVETITSDGINPIAVVFDLNERPEDPNSFFLMNGLEIEDASSNVVKIDFGNNAANISSAYEGYVAAHENPDTFGPVYYALGSGYVSVTPTWGQESAFASVAKTNTGLNSTADFATTAAGIYTLRLTAADDTSGGNQIPQVSWNTLDVQVVDDACAAAQLDTASWTGFLKGDINEDCRVDIEDLADLATEWLLTNEAGGSIEL